jgi:hypothetical protein
MKIFVNKQLNNINGKPFTIGDGDESMVLTLGTVMVTALRAQCAMDKDTGNGLIQTRFRLAKLIDRHQDSDKDEHSWVGITTDDVSMIKKRLEMISATGQGMEGFVVASAFEAIEDADKADLSVAASE